MSIKLSKICYETIMYMIETGVITIEEIKADPVMSKFIEKEYGKKHNTD